MIFDDGQRPEIVYPCEWDYKVIGIDIEKILAAIEDAAEGLSYDVTPSNISRNGKYFSLNLKVVVPSEEKRDLIFQFLSSHSDIRFVL